MSFVGDAVEPSSSTSALTLIPTPDPPIFRLPIELLQHIFLLACLPLPSVPEPYRLLQNGVHKLELRVHDSSPLGPSYRLPISHVCRRFREAAILCPRLWAYISYDMPVSHVEMALERAGSADLDLSMSYDFDVQSVVAFFRPLRRLESRWRSIRMMFERSPAEPWRLLRPLLGVSPHVVDLKLSNLRTFVLCELGLFRLNIAADLDSLFTCSPQLSHVELWGFAISLQTTISTSNLRSLHLEFVEFIEIESLAWLLGSLPQLKRLHIAASLPYENIHSRPSFVDCPIGLEGLESLSLRIEEPVHDAWFIDQMTCPSLRHLVLSRGYAGSSDRRCGRCKSSPQDDQSQDAFHEVYEAIIDKYWNLDTLDLAHNGYCPMWFFSEMSDIPRLVLSCVADLRMYFLALKEDAGSGHPDDPALLDLAIMVLEDPALLVATLDAEAPNPLCNLRTLYAPSAEFWRQYAENIAESALARQPVTPSAEESRARAILQERFPMIDSWPSWATTMIR